MKNWHINAIFHSNPPFIDKITLKKALRQGLQKENLSKVRSFSSPPSSESLVTIPKDDSDITVNYAPSSRSRHSSNFGVIPFHTASSVPVTSAVLLINHAPLPLIIIIISPVRHDVNMT